MKSSTCEYGPTKNKPAEISASEKLQIGGDYMYPSFGRGKEKFRTALTVNRANAFLFGLNQNRATSEIREHILRDDVLGGTGEGMNLPIDIGRL